MESNKMHKYTHSVVSMCTRDAMDSNVQCPFFNVGPFFFVSVCQISPQPPHFFHSRRYSVLAFVSLNVLDVVWTRMCTSSLCHNILYRFRCIYLMDARSFPINTNNNFKLQNAKIKRKQQQQQLQHQLGRRRCRHRFCCYSISRRNFECRRMVLVGRFSNYSCIRQSHISMKPFMRFSAQAFLLNGQTECAHFVETVYYMSVCLCVCRNGNERTNHACELVPTAQQLLSSS